MPEIDFPRACFRYFLIVWPLHLTPVSLVVHNIYYVFFSTITPDCHNCIYISNSKRRSDKDCKTEHRRSALASVHLYFIRSMLYNNRANKAINIIRVYSIPQYSCKQKCLYGLKPSSGFYLSKFKSLFISHKHITNHTNTLFNPFYQHTHRHMHTHTNTPPHTYSLALYLLF